MCQCSASVHEDQSCIGLLCHFPLSIFPGLVLQFLALCPGLVLQHPLWTGLVLQFLAPLAWPCPSVPYPSGLALSFSSIPLVALSSPLSWHSFSGLNSVLNCGIHGMVWPGGGACRGKPDGSDLGRPGEEEAHALWRQQWKR